VEDKISIERCKQLLGNDNSYSDEQIEQIRDYLYSFGALVVEKVKIIKDAFTKKLQSISCRAFIIK